MSDRAASAVNIGEKPAAGLREKLAAIGLALSDDFFAKADRFGDLLLKWNRTHNLSGARDKNAVEKHIFDSVFPLVFLDRFFAGGFNSAIDIGSGAGFPGLILAMAKKDVDFTLAEANAKKAAFLKFAAIETATLNAAIENKRAEDIQPRKHNLITSRAVGDAKTIYNLAEPFMNLDSVLLLYKGKKTAAEAELIGAEIISAAHAEYLIAKGKKD